MITPRAPRDRPGYSPHLNNTGTSSHLQSPFAGKVALPGLTDQDLDIFGVIPQPTRGPRETPCISAPHPRDGLPSATVKAVTPLRRAGVRPSVCILRDGGSNNYSFKVGDIGFWAMLGVNRQNYEEISCCLVLITPMGFSEGSKAFFPQASP